MPPKKKEKGGKGSKGAGVAQNGFDEPPQPTPGTPFCLTLVLEVSLPAKSSANGEGGDDQQPDSGEGAQQSNRQQSQDLLAEPVLRYTFVNGERITTPPIGAPDSSWTKLNPTATSDAAAIHADQSLTTSDEAVGAVHTDGQPKGDQVPTASVVWRYTRAHQLRGEDEDAVAQALDRNSMMLVTLADKSSRAATVQPPGRGAGGEGNSDKSSVVSAENSEVTSLPGRNFVESWPLDLSPFLAGETGVSIYAGNIGDDPETEGSRAMLDAPPARAQNSKAYDAPSAPEGIRHIRISVCVSGTGAAAPSAERGTTEATGDGGTAQAVSALGNGGATTAAGEAIDCQTKTLFSAEAMDRLNPLSIRITSAMSLPGVRIEAESLQNHVKPTRFRLLDAHCKPVYVVCRPFPNDPSGEALHPRILWTAGSAQRDRATFDHTASFLLGQIDRHRLEDWMENSILSVEVHDRDPRPSAKDQAAQVLRLEKMVAGGYSEEECACASSTEGPSRSKPKTIDGIAEAAGIEESSPTRYLDPRDIYDVDELVLREAIARAESAGKHNAHGVASFHLSGLLDQSRQLVMAYNNSKRKFEVDSASPVDVPAAIEDVAPRLKMRSEICQRKRREIPKGGVENWHLSDEERFVRWPGAYLDAGSSLGVRLSLARPARTLLEGSAERTGPATEELRPFSRAVLVVEYEEGGALVRNITAAMDNINGRALANIQGSLRAYVLTPEEKQAAEDATLDIVCGFTVIDEDSRTIVLEGVSGPRGGLTALLRKVGRAGPNGQAYRALENPEVRFSKRLYTAFDADLKKVRLRDPLPILCQNPEIYDRSKVSAGCFDALHSLRMLRKVNRLREAAEQGLFPEAAQLIQVESKYGESVSVKDITGRNPVKKPRIKPVAGEASAPLETSIVVLATSERFTPHAMMAEGDGETTSTVSKPSPARRKAPTDSANVAFEEWLRGRRSRDFLGEQDEILAKAHNDFLESKRRKEDERREETVRTEWCYGPHKLNYVELKKAEMRERLAKDRDATYTYSVDYVSQTVSMVDEFRVKEDQEAASRAAWKTKRGFVWPCPRTRQELITHPSKPSDSRIDALKESWVENELNGCAEVATGTNEAGGPPDLAWRRKFDTVPSNGKAVFGGLKSSVQNDGTLRNTDKNRSKYERMLDTDLIGNRSRLPRGCIQLEKDPGFFRSVHLVGEGLAREKEEAKRRTQELWQSKVVVDDTDFRVGNFSVRDTPLQVDRAKDILHPPINKKAFKIVRNARLPSGKRVPLLSAPVSAISSEPFAEPEDFTVSIRGNHRERWAATHPATGAKEDFHLRLHGDRMKPKSHKACARLKHPPLSPSEMHGPCWRTGRRKEVDTVPESKRGDSPRLKR